MRLQKWLGIGTGLLLALTAAAAMAQNTQSKGGSKNFSLELNNTATANDVGLPIYPGARPHKASDDSNSSINLGAASGDSGFHLAMMSLESDAQTPDVESFYRKALAKYGKILECRDKSTSVEVGNGKSEKSSKQLTCNDDKPAPGELVLKAGTREEQHVVSISRSGKLTDIQLVYLLQKGVDDSKEQ